VAAISISAYLAAATHPWVCTPGPISENVQKSFTAFDANVELGLKLATTLAGFGAAGLIGLKGGLRLTVPTRLFLFAGVVCFAQAAFYAVWYRFGVANAWLNGCPEIIARPILQERYQEHFLFFVLGLASLGALVAAAAVRRTTGERDESA